MGCSNRIVNWFASYLSKRRQRVAINGQSSDWAYILAGVPQGSILGRLLFLIYINDVVKHIGCSMRLFADDTSLYIIVDYPLHSAKLLNTDLQNISDWAAAWLVTFNSQKTLSMIISCKRNPVFHPPLFMNGALIKNTLYHNHLGLTFSNSGTWDEHVKSISEKSSFRLNLLRALKFRVLKLKIKRTDWLFVDTCPHAANHCALF